jgi:hypothetical protein
MVSVDLPSKPRRGLLTGVQRNNRSAAVPAIFVLLAAAAFTGCLLACSTLWQSAAIAHDLDKAGCTNQQAFFTDGTTENQGTDPGTLTLYCWAPHHQEVAVPPELLDRIIWREAPLNITSFDNGINSTYDISAQQLSAQLGPRPPGLGATGHRDALLLLGVWTAFVIMLVSSILAENRARFAWPLPIVALAVPIGWLAYITLPSGSPLSINLTTWMFPAMVPENQVGDVKALFFLLVFILGSTSFTVIVIRRRSTHHAVWTQPPQYPLPPPPMSPPWPQPAEEDDE